LAGGGGGGDVVELVDVEVVPEGAACLHQVPIE